MQDKKDIASALISKGANGSILNREDKYCFELAGENTKSLFPSLHLLKIVIVGVEGIGKTSFVKRVKNEWGFSAWFNHFAFKLMKQRKITDGIDIHQWSTEIGEEKLPVRAFLWDFAV